MLTSYLSQLTLLLQSPAAPSPLYATSDLTRWINIARGQLSGESECCRYLATATVTAAQRNYNFSSLSTGTASVTGLSGVLHVNSIRYAVGDGYQRVQPQQWTWFELFALNNPVPSSGAPENWTQYGQGASGAGSITGVGAGSLVSGSFYLDPIPDLAYVLTCDTVCYPQALAADADVEAIPYLWTDAVPYLAAYYALLSSQTNARMADAQRYFDLYSLFVQRAREAANSSVTRYIYPQANDPTQINKLGIQTKAAEG